MTHRQIYNRIAELSREHLELANLLSAKERKKFGFEFAETDSDRIIDTLNYGIDSYSFDAYIEEMKFYKKSAQQNSGDLKANGIFNYGQTDTNH